MGNVRRYDLDWLRIIGIGMLFPFHTSRIFDYWDPFYVKSENLSWSLSWFISLTNLWFMPLLFWLAGSASWFALRNRTNRMYVRERVDRLLIPLAVGVLFVVPPQGYFARSVHTGEELGSYLSFLQIFYTDFSDLSGYFGTFTPAHLWFILYLFVFSVAALPFFTFVKANIYTMQQLNGILTKPLLFLLLFVLLVISQLLPAPGGQNPFYYLIFFLVGYVTSSDDRYQDMFNRIRFKTLISLAILVPLWIYAVQNHVETKNLTAAAAFLTVFRMLLVWLSLITIIGYGNKFLVKPHPLLTYLNEAAFPIYILHQSVLVAVGYYILKLDLRITSSFWLIMLSSFLLSWVVYDRLIKRITLTRWMFGVKIKNQKLVPKQKVS
ncbi:acyltransferase family protein [Peribacillus deserti]|uniref:Acyltransferase 3 domain-containing protein n=1 Tax=Peribacillus deserti TaxID=673318 RepID=A0A2N5M122_9BACI|nr:acyltransferase family protein [Peribacillus deserti]PLT28057.1 hypothetical protein CUU66_20605 [Peribacillus deserti]